jgi:hypothetical protein
MIRQLAEKQRVTVEQALATLRTYHLRIDDESDTTAWTRRLLHAWLAAYGRVPLYDTGD